MDQTSSIKCIVVVVYKRPNLGGSRVDHVLVTCTLALFGGGCTATSQVFNKINATLSKWSQGSNPSFWTLTCCFIIPTQLCNRCVLHTHKPLRNSRLENIFQIALSGFDKKPIFVRYSIFLAIAIEILCFASPCISGGVQATPSLPCPCSIVWRSGHSGCCSL